MQFFNPGIKVAIGDEIVFDSFIYANIPIFDKEKVHSSAFINFAYFWIVWNYLLNEVYSSNVLSDNGFIIHHFAFIVIDIAIEVKFDDYIVIYFNRVH